MFLMKNNNNLLPHIEYVDRIIHMADIHIRTLSRHDEYKIVFDRLYEDIKKKSANKNETTIAVIAGDVVHAKTDITPELIEMTSSFLSSVADIVPTLVIPGNHDANLSNKSRMDALEPICKLINHEDLFYFKESTVFQIGQCNFAHCSQYDDNPDDWPRPPFSNVSGTKNIAIYHGAIDNSTTDVGYEIDSGLTVQPFLGYDIVLLGDIHKAQAVSSYRVERKRVSRKEYEDVYKKRGWIIEE